MTERNILWRMPDSYAQLVLDIAAKRAAAEAERALSRKPDDRAVEPSHALARHPGAGALTQ
jgi:hypothetical protein